ncbi:hypothetical protein ACOJVU_07750 [Mycobacterium sp. THU-M104]|uniref:LmrA/YxaF family transcription factor n=1 Tax=Mycobacterium sp. THU-M104 TaxID=3410515 RepID=UPI003B9A7F24
MAHPNTVNDTPGTSAPGPKPHHPRGPTLRETAATVFTAWFDGGTAYFDHRGLPHVTARELTVALVTALEGAFILARTLRDSEPLLVSGRALSRQYRGIRLQPLDTASSGLPQPSRHP